MASILQNISHQPSQKSRTQDLPPSQSSWIQDFKYDAQTLQLTVTLKGGSEYVYWNLPPQIYEELVKAPSKGSFFAKNIKGRFSSHATIKKPVGRLPNGTEGTGKHQGVSSRH